MLTLRFVPFSEIENLTSVGRIRKLLNIAKENKIVVLQGKLRKEEEKELIKATMEEINSEFRGIELAVIDDSPTDITGMARIKQGIISRLLGDRQGFTIIGSASLIKEIKKNPKKIELFTTEYDRTRQRRRRMEAA